jgi:hypothetical protein
VENAGRRQLVLDLSEPRLKLSYVTFDAAGGARYSAGWALPVAAFQSDAGGHTVVALPQTELIPGERARYQYLVRVPRPDLMLFAEFSVPVQEAVAPVAPGFLGRRPPARDSTTWAWTARKYLLACGARALDAEG